MRTDTRPKSPLIPCPDCTVVGDICPRCDAWLSSVNAQLAELTRRHAEYPDLDFGRALSLITGVRR